MARPASLPFNLATAFRKIYGKKNLQNGCVHFSTAYD